MESQIKQFRSRCSYERPINDFEINQKGNRQKTCFRHSKKRAFSEPVLGQWDEFTFEINEWSQPGQTKQLNLSYIFDISRLPVNFDLVPETDGNCIENYGPLNEAIN